MGLAALDQPVGTATLLRSLEQAEAPELREVLLKALANLRSEPSLAKLKAALKPRLFEKPEQLWQRQYTLRVILTKIGYREGWA